MVELGLILGIFSNLIFALGITSLLKTEILVVVALILSAVLFFLFKKLLKSNKNELNKLFEEIKNDPISLILFLVLIVSCLINFIGVLGPEISFDSLWYHLTIPKIYLQNQKIFFIPGGLFYYSAMPKLTEMFYLLSLVFSPLGIMAKGVHYLFGLFSVFSLFLLAKLFLKTRESLVVCVIFYLSLVVGWESITGYVDLTRSFYEILAIYLFIKWQIQKNQSLLIESAIMLGLAISTKLIAFASLPVFLILILIFNRKIKPAFIFLVTVMVTCLPWLIFAFISTGNPVYPIFSGILDQTHNFPGFNLLRSTGELWRLFYRPNDLSSPVYLIFLPFVVLFSLKKINSKSQKVLIYYFFLTLFFWVLTPSTGGFRFYLPYLPVLCLLIVISLQKTNSFFKKSFLFIVFASSLVNLSSRFLANIKFLPVVIGRQSKQDFLLNKLNFKNNDFFDPNDEISSIVKEDLVLVFGSHNLFYANFNFDHASYADKNKRYSYLLTQNQELDLKYWPPRLLYENSKIGTKLYLYGGYPK